MPSSFPGMDPYLEIPYFWSDVHHELISEVRAFLAPHLRPKYVARVEQVTFNLNDDDPAQDLYIVPDLRVVRRPHEPTAEERFGGGRGGVAVAEPVMVLRPRTHKAQHRYLEIRAVPSGEVVTVIEILSPANKRGGSAGRRRFQKKRDDVTAGDTNWLEIDLLRAGQRTPFGQTVPPHDYLVFSDRYTGRMIEEELEEPYQDRVQLLWPITVRQKLPVVAVPLRPGDPDVPLDLSAVLTSCYDRADYAADLDYAAPATDPLGPDDAGWADALLREKGLRPRVEPPAAPPL